MAEEKRCSFTESGFKAMLKKMKEIENSVGGNMPAAVLETQWLGGTIGSKGSFYIRDLGNLNLIKCCTGKQKAFIHVKDNTGYEMTIPLFIAGFGIDGNTADGFEISCIWGRSYTDLGLFGDEDDFRSQTHTFNWLSLYNANATTTADGLMSKTDKARLDSLYDLYLKYPQSDNAVYAIVNRQPEMISPSGKDVMVQNQATAASLALKSLEKGVLVIDEDTDPEMVEEMKELLGEELFNELAANSVKTMKLKPQLSVEEEIAQAKANYYLQKASEEAKMKAMLEMAQKAAAEEVKSSDVEPPKTEKQ